MGQGREGGRTRRGMPGGRGVVREVKDDVDEEGRRRDGETLWWKWRRDTFGRVRGIGGGKGKERGSKEEAGFTVLTEYFHVSLFGLIQCEVIRNSFSTATWERVRGIDGGSS
eukprot:764466-Hanusia_phi.AAC.3